MSEQDVSSVQEKLIEMYKKEVFSLAKEKIDQFFLNSDKDKMEIVFSAMFHYSKKEFRILAGNLSNNEPDGVPNSKIYINSLREFLNKEGTSLRILLNNFEHDKVKKTKLYEEIKKIQKDDSLKDKIQIKTTKEKFFFNEKEAHLSIGDDCFLRIEIPIEKRSALCNMGIPRSISDHYIRFFDSIFNKESDLLDFNSLNYDVSC